MTPQELTQASFIGCALLEPVRCRDSGGRCLLGRMLHTIVTPMKQD